MKVRKKRCKECNELFEPRYSTVQIACSPICAINYSKRKKEETKEKNDLDLEKAFIQKKQNDKLQTLITSVKNVCHLYIRLRDEGRECISCQTSWSKNFQAGHFYKAELFSSIKFNEFNINGQCQQCNLRKEGNESEYRVNLPNRIGLENFEELNFLASLEKKQNFKWNREALKEIRKYYQQKIKELKSR